jgi:hypothetical protein
MIWSEPSGQGGKGLHDHLVTRIASACADAGVSPEHASEIASAVTAYWIENFQDRALPSSFVTLMVSRALLGAGKAHAALRMAHGAMDTTFPGESVEKFLQARNLGPELWRVFSSSVVRPSRCSAYSGQVAWVLDLDRVGVDSGGWLEMSVHEALRRLIGDVADIWDESAGEGLLAVRGLRGFVRRAVQDPDALQPAEVLRYCADVLEHEARQRSWAFCPDVVDLEAPPIRRRRQSRHGGQARHGG